MKFSRIKLGLGALVAAGALGSGLMAPSTALADGGDRGGGGLLGQLLGQSQSVGSQSNEGSVEQNQGNGNINLSLALGILGDASTYNAQGNSNDADASIAQGNRVDQSQLASQDLDSEDGDRRDGDRKDGDRKDGDRKDDGHKDGDRKDGDRKDDDHKDGDRKDDDHKDGDRKDDDRKDGGHKDGDHKDGDHKDGDHKDGDHKDGDRKDGGHKDGGHKDGGHKDGDHGDNVSQSTRQEQSVGAQSNQAGVRQQQGNGNLNIAPAISILGGEARTVNLQGNSNDADASVAQGNAVFQDQGAIQDADVEGGSDGDVEQRARQGEFVGSQSNHAHIQQTQGNGNLNIAPAISLLGGDAGTVNAQGNSNDAEASVTQGNLVTQSQGAGQSASVEGDSHGRDSHRGYGSKRHDSKGHDDDGTVKQATGQSQGVGEQYNAVQISQSQGNGNISLAPAIAIGPSLDHRDHGDKRDCGCDRNHKDSGHKDGKHGDDRGHDNRGGGGAWVFNAQGNDNEANAFVWQVNSVSQLQGLFQVLSISR